MVYPNIFHPKVVINNSIIFIPKLCDHAPISCKIRDKAIRGKGLGEERELGVFCLFLAYYHC